jgi:ABC-2 type transport system ATP-binding protein
MIELQNASRWYGQVIGLNDVTCTLGPGLTALLGENGAGKSTMIKLITGQLKPTTGSVKVFGEAPFANPRILAQIGYCPETDALYETMTGRDFLYLMGRLSDIPKSQLGKRVDEVLASVKMTERAGQVIASYSKGMRQRIRIAQALLHNPPILVLDEPMSGLDPVGRREMRDLFVAWGAEGKTVIVSSHILYEVEQMTRNILLLYRGRLLAQGDVREIRSLIDRHPHRVKIRARGARELASRLLSTGSVLSVQLDRKDPETLEVQTENPDEFYTVFGDIVLQNGIVVYDFHSPDNNLEAVFRYLMER